MNILEQQIWPVKNWTIENFGLAKPGSRSVFLTKQMSKQGGFNTPAGRMTLEKIKARKKQAIKQAYNSVKKATTAEELTMPAIMTQFGAQNVNTEKLRLYLLQKWKRLGGKHDLVNLMKKNKVNSNGSLVLGNQVYKTLPEYNLWNPNGTPPNRNTLQDHNLIWKAEQLILQRNKNMLTPGKNYTNTPIFEARRLLSQVKNKSSLAYRNVNRQVKDEENAKKESANQEINNRNNLYHLNILEKKLKNSGQLNSSSHGQALRNKLNARKRQVANIEFAKITNKINKINTLSVLNHMEGLEKKGGKLNNPLLGPRIKAKINARRRQLQNIQAGVNAAKAAKNSNFQMYSGWINRNSSSAGLANTEKRLKNAKAFNHPRYGRNLRAKFNAKKRQLQNQSAAAVNKNFQMYSGWINGNSSSAGLVNTEKKLKNAKAFNHPQYGRSLRAKFNAKKRQLAQNASSAATQYNNKIYKLITSGTINNTASSVIPAELMKLRNKPNAKSQQMARNLLKKYINLMYGPAGKWKNMANNFKQQQTKLNGERYGPLHPELITNKNPWKPRRGWFW